ncbi:MAG: carbohydrate kinase [Aureliella sp.]
MQDDSKPKIAASGEILWDMFPSGPRFGGAPANFASHACSLGASVTMVSRVGSDELGEAALAKLDEANVDRRYVSQSDQYATGAVDITLDANGSASYQFGENEAWDHIQWTQPLQALASEVDLVCFGTLAQRGSTSRATIMRFLGSCNERAVRLLDLNLRPPHFSEKLIVDSLEQANALKVNDEELVKLAQMFSLDNSDSEDDIERSHVKQLASKFGLSVVAVTSGSRGGLIYREGEFDLCAARRVDVVDTVGAGDSFTAALAVGLLREKPIDAINFAACRIAEFVCTQAGPTPRLPAELLQELSV